ncbi:TBCD protein [Lactarius akahatsu]|uniref:TBCD protein n=1 Tax=Lactarius akahatsu TaxID=416441 RepID=A0AAD4LQJ7_9AGAM|nr:TBCD protein [Lactarius akahatsu]
MEAEGEPRILARFEKYNEFVALQSEALSLDDRSQVSEEEARRQTRLIWNICNIFSEYQEQSYLLDPFLEELVTPVIKKFKFYAQSLADGDVSLEDIATFAPELMSAPLSRVSYLLYNYLKFRGYKTIIRFFPHEITDLAVALNFAQVLDRAQISSLWPIQYVALLWISLICMIPFDLAQFDEVGKEGQTAVAIEAVARRGLTNSGIVRESAAILLSRLYVRKDMLPRLPKILHWAKTCAGEQNDIFECLGVYQTLCEIVKNSSSDVFSQFIPELLEAARSLQPDSTLCTNASIRKIRIKLLSRAALRLLPIKPRVSLQRGRVLSAKNELEHSTGDGDDGTDVPEEIEAVLEELFQALQDRDTVVRWSAAKGVARISERLPAEFIEQVVDTVIGLFSIHSIAIASVYDMPAIAESTWHGACLSCAELLRRGLIANDRLADAITWMIKALYFDIRKGAHSIGSNVRDAATYALWSLPRAYDTTTIAPLAERLARNLVSVSTYDREISIRRAASAAFQEYVGRTGVFLHGIDVLGKIDFFAVGIRRNAFLVAAPQVADHEEYRPFLIEHLLTVTLRHWEPTMRQLGAQSLRQLCELDLSQLGPQCANRARSLLGMSDPSDVHGGLLALIQLSEAFSGSAKLEEFQQKAFSFLADVPVDMIRSPRNELVTAAACQLIANSVSHKEILLEGLSSVPHWRTVIDLGLKHRKSTVQEAAAAALAAVSKLVDCSSIVQRFIREFRSSSPTLQQSLARLLGLIDYKSHPLSLSEAIDCLVASVAPSSEMRMVDVEARRNCMLSIQIILTSLAPHPPCLLSPDQVIRMYNALILGLEDYTTDERGDIGSRVRIASIQGLASVSLALLTLVKSDTAYFEYFPADLYQEAIAGILKQGVERLDSVRQQAGECIIRLLKCPPPSVDDSSSWNFHGEQLFEELLLRDIPDDDAAGGSHGWQDSAWIFPRAMNFLEIPEYRRAVLAGLLVSIGSKTNSTQRHVCNGITTYAKQLPIENNNGGRGYSLHAFVTDLITEAKSNLSKNNKVIPVLQVFNVLLETDALERLFESKDGTDSVQALFSIASRGVPKLKNVHRIQECMKILVNLLVISQVSESCVPRLLDFLAHEYPTIRGETAKYLYLFLQSRDIGGDTDEVEELLLETEWFSNQLDIQERATTLVDMLGKVVKDGDEGQ